MQNSSLPGVRPGNVALTPAPPRTTLLYRTLWRWHFYAGLFCIPFVLTLALSGMIYLFKPQIDAIVDRPYHSLPAGTTRSSPSQQIEAAIQAVPDSHFLKYTVPESERHAVIVSVADPQGARILVYVQPWTLEILRTVGYEQQFIRQVRTFHGELLAGTAGSLLVELAGNWAIVLLLTGLYLWWPVGRRGLGGVLYPRLQLSGRAFWRDLHAVTGFWVAFFALFLLLTGLPWTLVWNTGFNTLRDLVEGPRAVQEWTVSREHEQHLNQSAGMAGHVHLDKRVVAAATALQLAAPAELSLDPEVPGTWLLASDNGNRLLRTRAWIAADTGAVLDLKPYSERNALDLAIGIGISAHEGQLFGWLNQLLALLTALALMAMSISGFLLWRKRKPALGLGAPQALPSQRLERGVAMLTLLLAALLPLLALSLLLLWLLEHLLLRRLPQVRDWLGLPSATATP